ncbi:MAG TPA: ATP-binding protein [Ktedonobacteraceae bacterium]|jgi:heavy metal sensor kinase|nr:ATP-binding protein [Ktedonobacteraceae bacterium]
MKQRISLFRYPGIRLQLTFWYTGVFMVLMLTTGYLLYGYLQRSMLSSLDTDLRIRSHQVANDITYTNKTISIHNPTGELPGFDKDDAPRVNKHPNTADVNTDVLVRVLDAHGRIMGVTPAFQDILVPRESIADPLHGIPWQGNVQSKDGQQVRVYSRTFIHDGQTLAVIQVGASLTQFNRAISSLLYGLLFLIPIVLCLGALVSYILASRTLRPIRQVIRTAQSIQAGDLHQRVPLPDPHDEVRLLALTLNAMLTTIEESFTRERRFVADASHELRTPVAAIGSMADVALLQPRSPDQYIQTLDQINTEVERLGLLLTDLLALARSDEGQAHLQCESLSLDSLARTVLTTIKPLGTTHDLTLEIKVDATITLFADEARLVQMFMNLLENAIRYTPSGGTITITLDKDQQYARIQIQDTGQGIEATHLPHIFERFYRAHPAHPLSPEKGGSGLGLSIVDWIVRAHAGTITVKSEPGKGTLFTIRLPIDGPSPDKTGSPKTSPQSQNR